MTFTEHEVTTIHAELAAFRERVHKLILVRKIVASHTCNLLLSPTAAARPKSVVPGDTTDTNNYRYNSSIEDWNAACGLGYRRRWR